MSLDQIELEDLRRTHRPGAQDHLPPRADLVGCAGPPEAHARRLRSLQQHALGQRAGLDPEVLAGIGFLVGFVVGCLVGGLR